MPYCFPEDNAATVGSDTRRSWIKLAGIAESGLDPNPPDPPPDEPTITLAIVGSDIVESGNAGSFTATLSEVRLVDTILEISNGGVGAAEIITPQTILAGNTQKQMFVGNTGGHDGPVTITVTSDVVVNNTVQFSFTP